MTGQSREASAAQHLNPERWFLTQFSHLSSTDRSNLLDVVACLFGEGRIFRLATMCSGTEVPTLWFTSFIRAALSLLRNVDVDHVHANPLRSLVHEFSCEMGRQKQLWIQKTNDCKFLFRNVEDLCRHKAPGTCVSTLFLPCVAPMTAELLSCCSDSREQ